MKTVLHQLIEELEQLRHEVSCNMGTDQNMGKLEAFDEAIAVAKELIEKEKQQIIKAFSDGEHFDGYIGEATYYNETFNTETK